MAAPNFPYRGGHGGRPLTPAIRRHLANIGKQGGRAAGALRGARAEAKWAALAAGRDGVTIARISNTRGYQNGFKTGRRLGHGEGFEEGYEIAVIEIRRLILQGTPADQALKLAAAAVKVG